MKYGYRWFVILAIASSTYGCAIGMPGDHPDPVPPRLHIDAHNVHTWDRPGAFGPVPADLQSKGDAICKEIGFEKASGYHPEAENADGKPIPGGGYFCTK